MTKWLSCFLVLALFVAVGCKKEEDQKSSGASNDMQMSQETKAQPAKETAKVEPKKSAVVSPLEIYNEKDLVTTIPVDQFKDVFTAKLTIGGKKMSGILARDLLQKYKVKGAYVIFSGPFRGVSLRWTEATADGLYVAAYQNNVMQLVTDTPDKFPVKDFPGRLVKITASAAPAPAKAPQTAKSQKGTQTKKNQKAQ
jgi:hypothetical protein